MGAWGLGLFQSDHDYDYVADLSHEAGLSELEEKAVNDIKAGKQSSPTMRSDAAGRAKPEERVFYSIYADLCSDVPAVRKHLDNSGTMVNMFAKYHAKLDDNHKGGYYENGYVFVLLGACAMSLGCKIPKAYKASMRKHYKSVGLMRDALTQMEQALNGRDGFRDGEPYSFGSAGLHQVMESGGSPNGDRIYPNMLNVEAPGGFPADFMRSMGASVREMMDKQKQKGKQASDDKDSNMTEASYGEDACGGCGAAEGKQGAALLICGKCKKRKYCSTECQKKQWKYHKLVCKAPMAGKENQSP